jgi:hypothetical protein
VCRSPCLRRQPYGIHRRSFRPPAFAPFLMEAIFGQVILVILSSLLAAFVIRWATVIVASVKPRYWHAVGVSLLCSIIGFLAQLLLVFCLGLVGLALPKMESPSAMFTGAIGVILLVILVTFLVHATITGLSFRDQFGELLGVGRGMLVVLLEIPIGIAFALGIGVVVAILVFAAIAVGAISQSPRELFSQLPTKLPPTYRPALPSFSPATPPPRPPQRPASPSDLRFASVEEAKQEAVRRHPQLGVPGSAFNREYLARHRQYKKDQPAFFNDTSWPVYLAEELAADGY